MTGRAQVKRNPLLRQLYVQIGCTSLKPQYIDSASLTRPLVSSLRQQKQKVEVISFISTISTLNGLLLSGKRKVLSDSEDEAEAQRYLIDRVYPYSRTTAHEL